MLRFEAENRAFLPRQRMQLRPWLQAVAHSYGFLCKEVSYQFMNDDELLDINRQYLRHDYYTDIITFDNRHQAGQGPLEADLCISAERVAENAAELGVPPDAEMRRVMVHGLLHLCGLSDKTEADAGKMRAAEDAALQLWDNGARAKS